MDRSREEVETDEPEVVGVAIAEERVASVVMS
jgi:hypothetical protein